MRLRVRRWLLVVATAFLFSGAALASGRAGAKVEVGRSGQFSIRVYAERVVWRLGDIEVASGVDARLPEGLVTPYTAFNWYGDRFWVSLEAASDLRFSNSFETAFKVIITAGVIW